MKLAIVASILCLLLPLAVWAQPDQPDAGEEAATESQPRIKIISLTAQGGWFSGSTYFELPKFWPRTEIAEGGNLIYSFDGKSYTPPSALYAPIKEIEPGWVAGGRIGFFLSRNFHIDLVASYGKSRATATFMYDDPLSDAAPYRVNLDEATDPNLLRLLQRSGMGQGLWTDDGFTIYKGGGILMYDAYDFRLLGLVPSFGLGVGGIINRFSHLPDKTALYFELSGGLILPLSSGLQISALYSATMLNLDTEELHYGKQVTYGLATFGLTWNFDVSQR
jgi:hypothetical protein